MTILYVRMSSSSSSLCFSLFDICNLGQPLCFCELDATLRYSNTKRNPNRLFFGCPKYNTKGLPYCKYFKWADGDQCRELDLQARLNEVERKEKEVEKRLSDIEQMEIELHKRAAEIDKKEMVQSTRDEAFLKNELVLLEQDAGIRRSSTLLRVY
ncbi:uncharacterized protein LOC122317440 [Carya illinoinensis]|uniref:uncharacterized protein LOC122317440 n=1 Tax=Carya illinoinensis TaxID=32201 RepID=UPI001C7284A5|nr:uncharacterized protein LOC122317440 [Carya illinoinensis]